MLKVKAKHGQIIGIFEENEDEASYYSLQYKTNFKTLNIYGDKEKVNLFFSIYEAGICSNRIIQEIEGPIIEKLIDVSDETFNDMLREFFEIGMSTYVKASYEDDFHYYGEKINKAFISTQSEEDLKAFDGDNSITRFLQVNNFTERCKYKTDSISPRYVYIRDYDKKDHIRFEWKGN